MIFVDETVNFCAKWWGLFEREGRINLGRVILDVNLGERKGNFNCYTAKIFVLQDLDALCMGLGCSPELLCTIRASLKNFGFWR